MLYGEQMDNVSTPPRGGPRRGGLAAEDAYLSLKRRLTHGHYRAAERIDVDALRVEFGVSKQPIMEALRRLSAEGLVVIVPQVGCRVVDYDHADVTDFFALMAAVEGLAAAQAAERRTTAQLARLDSISSRIGVLGDLPGAEDRTEGYLSLNREFHSQVHQMSGTSIVEEIGSGLYDRADLFIHLSTSRSPLADTIAERHADHERIRDAIARSDAIAADRAARDHIFGTVELIERSRALESR